MTEKHYGGESGFGHKNKPIKSSNSNQDILKSKNKKTEEEYENELEKEAIRDIKKAGEIVSQVKKFIKSKIKPGMPLLEIAELIESKIIELGGEPAFPTNLSINEIAAHSTPSFNDQEIARGLLKVDFGVHVDGFAADNAFSLDLENSEENKLLIKTAESALSSALEIAKLNHKISEIGRAVETEAKKANLQPIINLSGHSISQYNLHSGITIPNFDNSSNQELPEGVFAIEPFITNGVGKVRDGKPSGIYQVSQLSPIRDPTARRVFQFIEEKYSSLPFCSRWIYKEFGSRGLLALRQLETQGILFQYAQLVEVSGKKVAQAEETLLITDKEKVITTI